MSLLRIEDVRKRYPGVQALAGVDLTIDAGEVHALLGANGAGKSTLMKVIAGSVKPDGGRIFFDGEEVTLGSPQAARAAGIGIVYQELSLVPSLSIGENVLLGRWPMRLGTVDWDALFTQAAQPLRRIGFDVDVRRRVDGLGMAERQLVEIAKALSSDVRVLLLDEPTSALSEREAQRLFEVIHGLKSSGVAIVYVSHRLREVLEIADRITVLRDGTSIGTAPRADLDESHLVRMMVGAALASELAAEPSAARSHDERELVFSARGLARRPRLKPVDLDLHAGEIVGVFGLVGAGRTRLARTLFGLEPATEGTIELSGTRHSISSPVDAIRHGFGYLGEDRVAGIVPAHERGRQRDAGLARPDRPRSRSSTSAGSAGLRSATSRTWGSASPRSISSRRRCPAGTSRRSCSPAGSAQGRGS